MICLSVALCAIPAPGQSQPSTPGEQSTPSAASAAAVPASEPADQQPGGSISGTVVDQSGTALARARVTLAREDGSVTQEAQSDDDGQFFFVNVSPGPFRLTMTAAGFTTQTAAGTLHPGEAYKIARVALAVADVMTEVRVTPSQAAEAQLKDEEKQRVLGMVPNFYVTYIRDAAPLDAKQKFQLAWKSSIDPVTFGIVGATAGLQQAANQFGGYGQGAQGYGKRLGAAYADVTISTFIGGAILPSLLKQDPRYFYKGRGSKRSRIMYALAASVICKGDNGHWQANYSNILGSVASGGISNLYYPPQSRNDAALTFESAALAIGATAGANLLQEFVVPKLTLKKASSTQPVQP
ncbi:MAG TPA: carboxypeptidase-like regulatory domain-containing protein [Candidatus Acidoferrales bacterium]|nr:carboxypeptidase-like regulatory domain-containing protein [Candidatus Acidoferrales bacterium]